MSTSTNLDERSSSSARRRSPAVAFGGLSAVAG